MTDKIALVIDDDRELAQAFQAILELDHITVKILSDSRQAMETIQELQPLMVTLDVDMPHVSGIQILEAIQADETLDDLKVIMITASREVNEYQSVLNWADLVLMKPITLTQVRDFVSRIINQ